jgi:transcriptional regulator with XRE-family HTH domain
MSQREMAELLGIRQSLVSKHERGVSYPTIPRLVEIADKLKIHPGELFNVGSKK